MGSQGFPLVANKNLQGHDRSGMSWGVLGIKETDSSNLVDLTLTLTQPLETPGSRLTELLASKKMRYQSNSVTWGIYLASD
jgi:hypothetical protein